MFLLTSNIRWREGQSEVVMLLDSVYFALPKIDWEDKMTSNSYGGGPRSLI